MRFTDGDGMSDDDREFTGPYGGRNQTAQVIDLTGAQCGAWTVLRFHSTMNSGEAARWLCRCVCGTEKVIYSQTLRRGTSRGCGCKQSRAYNRSNGE